MDTVPTVFLHIPISTQCLQLFLPTLHYRLWTCLANKPDKLSTFKSQVLLWKSMWMPESDQTESQTFRNFETESNGNYLCKTYSNWYLGVTKSACTRSVISAHVFIVNWINANLVCKPATEDMHADKNLSFCSYGRWKQLLHTCKSKCYCWPQKIKTHGRDIWIRSSEDCGTYK